MSKLLSNSDLRALSPGQYASCQNAAATMTDVDLAEKIGNVERFITRHSSKSFSQCPELAAASEEITAYKFEQARREMVAYAMR